MHKLRSFRSVLVTMLILINFLIHGNAVAECPEDPCPKQTIPGEIVDNPDMALQWATGHPPSEISPGETLEVKVTGGLPKYG